MDTNGERLQDVRWIQVVLRVAKAMVRISSAYIRTPIVAVWRYICTLNEREAC